MTTPQIQNPITLFVEAVKQFAKVEDADIKKALFKLGDVVADDSIRADYEPSSEAETAAEDWKVELGEYEARLLAEAEADVEAEVTREEEDEVPLEIEEENQEEEEVPLEVEEET